MQQINMTGTALAILRIAYSDGTFAHAWSPGLFIGAKLFETRKGKLIYITSFNQEAVKEVTLSASYNTKTFEHKNKRQGSKQ